MESNANLWLGRVCQGLPSGVARACLVLSRNSGDDGIAAAWPEAGAPSRKLANAAHAALVQRSVLVEATPASAAEPRDQLRISVPLTGSGGLLGAVALEILDCKEDAADALAQQLRAESRWLTPLLQASAPRSSETLLVDLLALGLEQPDSRAAATSAMTLLATRLGCERVSVGFVSSGRNAVEAVSHSPRLPKRSSWADDVAAAMDEACDQDASIVSPAPDGQTSVVRAHEELRSAHADGAVCTVPFVRDGAAAGAVCFERGLGGGFAPDDRELCETIASLLGALLGLRREADAGPLPRARRQLAARWRQAVGPDQARLKLAAAVLGPVLLFLALAPGDFRVTSDALLEGRVQRAVVARVEGFVAEASARAGDPVSKGDVLARLDDRDLRLEHRKRSGQREQLRQEQREALAAHDRARIKVLSARVAQTEAQLRLIEENLARTRLRAPFDGVVIRGDLTQSLGSPVKKGDVLFEVAPADGYRIILQVDERDIARVEPGQTGQLALAALPGRGLPLTVDRVTPVARAENGSNHYRVEARLDEPIASLRPGMAGVAKVDVGRRRLLWIWTHRALDQVRLWAWSWWP